MGQGGRPVQDGVVESQRLAARHPEHMADAVLGQQAPEESPAMTARLIHAHDRRLLSCVYEIARCLPPPAPATGGVYQTTVFATVCQAAGSPDMWRAYAPGGGGAVEPRTATLPEQHRLGVPAGLSHQGHQ